MPDRIINEALEKAQTTATMLWAAMFASLGVYVVVVVILKDQLPFVLLEPPVLSALRLALVLVTGIVLAITPKLYWRTLASAYGRRDVSEHEGLSVVSNTYISALVIVMALYESIGICGLVLVFLGAGVNTFIGFMGVAAIAMLTVRPKMETLVEHYSKAAGGLS